MPARAPWHDESVASFFRRRFGAATVDLIAQPLLGGIHAGDIEQLSMPSLFPRFIGGRAPARQRPAHHVVAGRRRAVCFARFAAGWSELVDAIVHKLPPGAMLLDTPVSAIGRTPAGWTVTAGGDVFDAAR